MFDYSKQD